ncbi:MAG: sortase [Dermatophilaceae bacterium]|nr:sortase [Dermatophilaceae bacterium]
MSTAVSRPAGAAPGLTRTAVAGTAPVKQSTAPGGRAEADLPSVTPFTGATAATQVENPRARRRRRRAPMGPTTAAVSGTMIAVSAICLWFLLQTLLLGAVSHNRAQTELYSQLRATLADGTAPTGGAIEPGEPVALLTIPTLHLQEVVVEGTSSVDTLGGPGHRRNTVLPGQAGTAVVMGRASTYGAPFRDVVSLHAGDRITTVTALGTSTFVVDRVRRSGDPVPKRIEGAGRLTLVSAEGSGSLAGIRPRDTVYVDATLAGAVQPSVAGRPATVPSAETEMGTDTSALPMVVLGLGALVALVVGCFRASARWRPVLVWTVAAPVALAATWWTTDLVMRTLPNLM